MGKIRNMCKAWWQKPEGKRPLGRPRCRGKNSIKMRLKATMSGYGLDDRAIGVRSPAEAKEFFL
jgi:hypothetical protein